MFAELDSLDEMRLGSYKGSEDQKIRIARAYNKKVKPKSFEEGKWVWKTILPLDTKERIKSLEKGPQLGKAPL